MLCTLLLLIASASPIQSLQDELRTHPWRYQPSAPPAKAVPTAPQASTPSSSAVAKTAGAWSIQVASLSTEEAALKRKQELEAVLGKGALSLVPSSGAWKLRYGSYPDRKSATKAKDELSKKDIDGFPVEP
jgi:cell division septation protein DedD